MGRSNLQERNDNMRNLLFTIRYCGTNYHGFQVQQNGITVCQVFQDAVENLLGRRWAVKGCSRTDAGVHANRFCLSMLVDDCVTIGCEGLVRALNVRLPADVAVLECREVPEGFHARYDCKGKRYRYLILNSQVRDPFLEGRAYRFGTAKPLDHQLMHKAAQGFLGQHDFSAFCATGGSVEDKVRTMMAASVTRQQDLVCFEVTGDGFLYNMVRIMAGTLLDVAMGRTQPEEIGEIIASRDRSRAGMTLPACGLYLDEVFYELPPAPKS